MTCDYGLKSNAKFARLAPTLGEPYRQRNGEKLTHWQKLLDLFSALFASLLTVLPGRKLISLIIPCRRPACDKNSIMHGQNARRGRNRHGKSLKNKRSDTEAGAVPGDTSSLGQKSIPRLPCRDRCEQARRERICRRLFRGQIEGRDGQPRRPRKLRFDERGGKMKPADRQPGIDQPAEGGRAKSRQDVGWVGVRSNAHLARPAGKFRPRPVDACQAKAPIHCPSQGVPFALAQLHLGKLCGSLSGRPRSGSTSASSAFAASTTGRPAKSCSRREDVSRVANRQSASAALAAKRPADSRERVARAIVCRKQRRPAGFRRDDAELHAFRESDPPPHRAPRVRATRARWRRRSVRQP